MTSVSEKVLKNIEQHHITPKPKWVFSLQNVAIWFSSVVFLLIGGFAFSVVIYMLLESDWRVYQNMNNNVWGFTLLVLPYFWILVLAGLVVLAHYNLKNTKSGYRHRLSVIVLFVFVISMVIGSALYLMGVGRAIDEKFADRMPMYEEFINKMNRDKRIWMNPERGLLGGMIVSVENANQIKVSDFNNDVWVVNGDNETMFEGFEIGANRAVKIIGSEVPDANALAQGERVFHAKTVEVLPDLDFIKRHPRGPKRMIEMNANIQRQPLPPTSFMHMEYKDEATSSPEKCAGDSECETPFSFMVRSSCPFESKCIEEKCRVACPIDFGKENGDKNKCKYNQDCNCATYVADDKKDCVCFKNECLMLVE